MKSTCAFQLYEHMTNVYILYRKFLLRISHKRRYIMLHWEVNELNKLVGY